MPSGSIPGSTRGRAPVAMMMCFAWYEPGPSAPFGAGTGGPCTDFVAGLTVTLPGASIAASPQITSILFFFIRKPTPAESRAETSRERLTMAAASYPTLPSIVSPYSFGCCR